MALSHPLKFSIDLFSRLLIITLAMPETSDYQRAYETAKRELTDLMEKQEQLEKRKLALRKTIEVLAALCDSEGIPIEPSAEAGYLLHSSLADEIRSILKARYPEWLQPLQVKKELEGLGHDLSNRPNPQATIHMVLKRMAESSGEAEEDTVEGKKAYRMSPIASGGYRAFVNNLTYSPKGKDKK
jgi:hypothetical protein